MMRLLHRVPGGDFELKSFPENPPPYAILSHTWVEGQEVTFNELEDGIGKEKSGYDKIRFCGERAEADNLEYFWVDTCCIDKSSVVELSTAINSMFRFYKQSEKCYVYLLDVSIPEEVTNVKVEVEAWLESFRKSRWFTRGWTLQELVAPASVDFFSKEAKWLGNKMTLEQEIHGISRIPIQALRGQSLDDFPDNERIGWVQTRTTTMKEDKVYCLLGIFGIFLPLIYGEGEIYAMSRLKDEVRRVREGQGNKSLEDLFTTPSLPFSRNEFFVGREDHLKALEALLVPGTQRRQMTIYGLGGTGKSSLALHFAYHSLATSDQALKTFLVPAVSRQSFELAYREIGIRLRIPGITDDNADVKQLVNEALSSGRLGQWLLIIDNADDPEVLFGMSNGNPTSSRLSDILPCNSDQGAILFTTRNRKTAVQLTQSHILELKELNRSEAETLLKSKIANQALCQDQTAIEQLLELLEYLPLAIVHAAAFINSNDITVSAYVSLFQDPETKAELLNEQFEDPVRYREMDSTIAKTWHISFNQICKQDPLAAKYLSFMACVDRINIPATLLPPGRSKIEQVKAFGTLSGYAFLTERQRGGQVDQDRFFDMHRLVHLTSGRWLDEKGKRVEWAGIAAARLEELVPYDGHGGREIWTKYLLHAAYVAGLANVVDGKTRAWLFERVGYCQKSLGQYAAAETSYRQSSMIRGKILGSEDRDTLISMNNLALMLFKQDNQEEAELINRQNLIRTEKFLGGKDPVTLMVKNNLAGVLERRGKYNEAETLHRQTLAQLQETEPNHPSMLRSKNNLAGSLLYQGKYNEAELILREAVAQHEEILGAADPNTISTRLNLATALHNQCKYEEAELMIRQAITQKEELLGDDHPDTLWARIKLAETLQCQNKLQEAEQIFRSTILKQEEIVGLESSVTLSSKNALAHILSSQGMYDEAEELGREIVAQQEHLLGPEHAETLRSTMNLTYSLERQNKDREAEALSAKVLALRKQSLGPEHPETLMSMYCHARLLAKRRNYVEALALYEKAEAGCIAMLGEEHQSTLLCRQYHSEMLVAQRHEQLILSSATSDNKIPRTQAVAKSKIWGGLAKFGFKRSKSPPK